MQRILANGLGAMAAAVLLAATATRATEPAAPAKAPAAAGAATGDKPAAAMQDSNSTFDALFRDLSNFGLNGLFGSTTRGFSATKARPDPGDPVSVRSDPGDPVAPKPTPKPGTTPK